ncbi:glycosyltransferase [Aeromicrobium duanguangcaii]|uniref:glycosyltransferase n=1 Tax=Aeromicrobium duanguangcaii TaxID=2968086 RepID=UPI0020176C25|nr:glycosyltransferase [Aeromicrobium duanguangcaii]MCL3837114.1 glycosyltransferase family 2 protein [Aeromicrobium duanguangcaii]
MTEPPGPAVPPDADLDHLDVPEAVRDHYRSVDSAPIEYSVDRPDRVVNACLVSFAALGLLVLLAMVILVRTGWLDERRDAVFYAPGGDRALIPVRIFILVFFVVFSLSLATNAWRRAWVLLQLCGGLLLTGLLIDTAAWTLEGTLDIEIPVAAQQIASGIVALAIFPVVVLYNAHLPEPLPRPARFQHLTVSAWLRFFGPLTLAVILAELAARRFDAVVWTMREFALIGGVGPGVFLVQQLIVLLAFVIGTVVVRRSRQNPFAPAVGVVVPAYNEAHDIAATIGAIDVAAGAYSGPVRLYVVDNDSTDDTAEIAQRAIDRAQHLSGIQLKCHTAGKARALNYGIARITEPFVVRVDADVMLDDQAIVLAARHFHDPRVGAVGGVPIPARAGTFFSRVRTIEVLVRHAYFQVARTGYEGIVGVPGMFTMVRRSALAQAGPIREGINGEDTDLCMRLNALGYLCLADPRVRYLTETPHTWAHMREQRLRWFRSTYHVASHHRRTLLRAHSMAGVFVLPFALFNSARRALLAPLLLFAVLVFAVFPNTFSGLRWQPVLAMIVGLPALVAVAVCVMNRQPRALLYVPEYLVFRIIRSYFTLGAVLSLRFDPLPPPWRRGGPRTGLTESRTENGSQ